MRLPPEAAAFFQEPDTVCVCETGGITGRVSGSVRCNQPRDSFCCRLCFGRFKGDYLCVFGLVLISTMEK